jgi:signal transduction histidine kinase
VSSKRSLRGKFVVAISALVGVVLAINALVQVLTDRRELRRQIEQRALGYAKLAADPVCRAYETYYSSGFSKFQQILRDLYALNQDLDRIQLYDTTGALLFDSLELDLAENAEATPASPPPPSVEELRAMKATARSGRAETGERVWMVVAPLVEEWGRHRYAVVFTFDYDSLGLAVRTAAWNIFWLAVAALLLGVAAATALSRQSLGPLETLTLGARELAEGRLRRRISLRTGDEFELLASTLNQMAERLDATISDLETSNRALNSMNLELQEVDRLKSDLLANVSHELRTPLTAIRGYSEALQEGLLGALSDAQRQALEAVDRNASRLLKLIEQLLSYSRLQAGAAQFVFAPFDLREVGRQLVSTLRAAHGPRLNLELEAPEELPPVLGDASAIGQVIENLLSNAIKFTPPGGEIRLRLRRRDGEVEVEVSDRGIGIPRRALDLIFDRFFQVDSSSTRAYGGVGLGLAIVREILRAHGRTIAVDSTEGRGTTFRFALGLAAAGRADRSARRAGDAVASG